MSAHLTAKQKRFVEEYAADPNATQAYFRAFGRYTSAGKKRSYRSAQKAASRLVSDVIISAEIEAANAAHARRIRISKARVLRELAALAFADPDDLYEPDPQNGGLAMPRAWRDIPPSTRKAVQSVKVKRRKLKQLGEDDGDGPAAVWEVEELEYRLHPKLDALDKLCKRLGLFATDDEGKGDDGGPAELLARLGTLLAARQSAGGTGAGSVSVEPQPGAAERGVQQSGG